MMLDELRKIGVFIKRDFHIMLTYRLAFSAMFLNMVFSLLYFILFGSMFGTRTPTVLLPYGGDYIYYLLVGSIGWGFLWTVMNATSASLRNEMMMGTLESVMLTVTRISTIVIAYTIFGCLMGLLTIAIILIVGFFLFGITIIGNIYAFFVMFLSTVMMMGLGMVFGGLTLWIKNIGNTIPLIQNIAMFFCGVYFPITILPKILQPIAKFIPFYYSIEGLRKTLQINSSLSEIYYFITILVLLDVLFIFLGLFTLRRGVVKAKRDGSLSFY